MHIYNKYKKLLILETALKEANKLDLSDNIKQKIKKLDKDIEEEIIKYEKEHFTNYHCR